MHSCLGCLKIFRYKCLCNVPLFSGMQLQLCRPCS
jgi:hypothetical protein